MPYLTRLGFPLRAPSKLILANSGGGGEKERGK